MRLPWLSRRESRAETELARLAAEVAAVRAELVQVREEQAQTERASQRYQGEVDEITRRLRQQETRTTSEGYLDGRRDRPCVVEEAWALTWVPRIDRVTDPSGRVLGPSDYDGVLIPLTAPRSTRREVV